MRTQAAETLFSYYKLNVDVNLALTRRADAVLPYKLTMQQFELMDFCCLSEEEVTPLQAALHFNLTKGAITNLLRQLTGKGFVDLTNNPADGRSKYILVTEEGKKAHRHSLVALSEMTSHLLNEISSDEIKTCMPILIKLKNWLDNS